MYMIYIYMYNDVWIDIDIDMDMDMDIDMERDMDMDMDMDIDIDIDIDIDTRLYVYDHIWLIMVHHLSLNLWCGEAWCLVAYQLGRPSVRVILSFAKSRCIDYIDCLQIRDFIYDIFMIYIYIDIYLYTLYNA